MTTEYQRAYDAAISDMANGLVKAAFRMAERQPLENVRRVGLGMAVQAHRRAADIIEAVILKDAPEWKIEQNYE